MLLIKGAHVVDPQVGLDTVTDVLVEGARIARVGANIKTPEGAEVIDGTGKYLVPGLTDIHVHFRDPGYEYKETIETGSAAAAHPCRHRGSPRGHLRRYARLRRHGPRAARPPREGVRVRDRSLRRRRP